MTRGPSVLALVFTCTALACGGGDGNGDGNPDAGSTGGPDAAYWGLADKTCLRYADSQGRLRYTVEVLFDRSTVTGVETWSLIHRFQGFEQRTDWIEVTDDALVLHRRNVAGQLGGQDTLHRFDPAPVLLREGLDVGASLETETNARLAGGSTAEETQTFRTASLGDEDVEGPNGTVSTQKLTLSVETPSGTQVERAWFAPQLGFVKLDPVGSTVEEVTLRRVDPIAAGEVCSAE